MTSQATNSAQNKKEEQQVNSGKSQEILWLRILPVAFPCLFLPFPLLLWINKKPHHAREEITITIPFLESIFFGCAPTSQPNLTVLPQSPH